jgi:tetratricopeptide (TPR) repeat protein
VTAASDLIGRNQEFGVLADLIDHSGERGGAIVVLGDPGIGKSSLLRAAAEYGRRESLRVLTATGIEAEAQLPFAGLHQLLRPVLDAADQLPPAQRAALAVALGDAARVFQLCAMAGRSIEAGDTSLALNLLFGAGLRCWWADTGPAARARVAEVTQLLSREVGSDPRYAAALALAEPVLRGRQVIQLLQGVVLDSAADPVALWMFGGAATAVGEPVLAMDFFARAEASLRQQGRLGLLAQVLVCRVSAAIELGEWRAAESDADEGRRLAQETGQPVWITASFALKAIVTALRGHYEQAQAMADQVENNAGAKLTDLLANAQLARGFSLVTVGQYDKAYDQLRRMFDPGDPTYHPTERYHAVMFLAEAAVHADRVDDARAVVAALAHEATVTPSATLAGN